MRVFGNRLSQAALAAVILGLGGTISNVSAQAPAPPAQAPASRIDDALQNVTTLVRAGQVGYATFWDGNKYIQCRRMPTRELRCEAAGTSMQPSLRAVLTGERLNRLAALGWVLNPKFGNYVHTFAQTMSTAGIADHITLTLTEAYDTDTKNLEIKTDWIADVPCPPRNGYTQNLAGIVSDAPSMQATAVRACSYTPPPETVQTVSSSAELIAKNGATVAAEIQRLRINFTRDVFVVFNAGIGYIQCMPEAPVPTLYCEAQSAESWPALATILTPERVARLHNAGFTDPGRAPNYWKEYPFDKFNDAAIASEILTLLHGVYGYNGAAELTIKAR